MLGAALLLTLALVVEPAGGCPSAAQIEAQLRALEAPTAPGPPLLVRVTRAGDHLHLSLRDGSGAERAARELPTGASCADLAAAAAVVISGWQAAVPAEDAPGAIRFAPPPPPPPPLPPPLPWEVSGTAQVALTTEGKAALGGALSAALGPREGRLAALLTVFGADLRPVVVADGRAEWTRFGAGLGAQLLVTPPPRTRYSGPQLLRPDLRLRAAGLLAGAFTRGVGFLHNNTATALDVGLLAGARLGLRLRGLTPFLDLALCGWLRPQVLLVSGQAATRELPRLDLLFGLGLAGG